MKSVFKYSGLVQPDSLTHSPKGFAPDGALIPPVYVPTAWKNKDGSPLQVPQYAETVHGKFIGYNPPNDCDGYYMSSKYQPNNNCYAYATVICTNTFPQPGRASLGSTEWTTAFSADVVKKNAMMDGLVYVGTTIEEIEQFHRENPNTGGHFVALMFSQPEKKFSGDPKAHWGGDYHWARCNHLDRFDSWSQKDGSDQVTNFDFAGYPITNPAKANWTVNQGLVAQHDANELIVTYDFVCFMFVPAEGVKII